MNCNNSEKFLGSLNLIRQEMIAKIDKIVKISKKQIILSYNYSHFHNRRHTFILYCMLKYFCHLINTANIIITNWSKLAQSMTHHAQLSTQIYFIDERLLTKSWRDKYLKRNSLENNYFHGKIANLPIFINYHYSAKYDFPAAGQYLIYRVFHIN